MMKNPIADASGSRAILLAVALLVGAQRPVWSQAPTKASSKPTFKIADVRVGLQGRYFKVGYWLPIAVDIEAVNDNFTGTLEFATPDPEDLITTITCPVFVERNDRKTITHHIKLGGFGKPIDVTLKSQEGKVVDRQLFETNDYNKKMVAVNSEMPLMVAFGSSGGLATGAEENDQQSALTLEVARLITTRELPTQWHDYESVRWFMLPTAGAAFFDGIELTQQNALKTWVRQGGRLVISCANNWQVVQQSFLGEMLPAALVGSGNVRTPDSLEAYVGAKDRLDAKNGLPVAKVDKVTGREILKSDSQPLVITGAYGLGEVTLITFDVDENPFKNWKGRRDFWSKLLNIRRRNDASDEQRLGRVGGAITSDVATVLRNHLEHFDDVAVVPFGWVALLIFGYILLIGPIDYFFLKKVVGRLELTWITFPTWVVVISVAAYYTAHWLKGDELRINRFEMVDIDQGSKTLRGSSYMSIFSPRIAEYTLGMQPALGAAGAWKDLGAGADQTTRVSSWLGMPEDAFGGLYSQGKTGLFGRGGYQYHSPDASGLIAAPIKVWSVKTFAHRWLSKADVVLEGELESADLRLLGSLTNKLDQPLKDVLVCHHFTGLEINEIPAGGVIDLGNASQARPRSMTDILAVNSQDEQSQSYNMPIPRLARRLAFGARTTGDQKTLASHYLHDLNLLHLVELGKVVVFARVENKEGGELWLGKLPTDNEKAPAIPGVVKTNTYLRVVLDPKRNDS